MSEQQQEPDATPYITTLVRALFPHKWLNQGRPLLGWKWVRFNDRSEQQRWLSTYRFEIAMTWLSVLLAIFWVIVHAKAVSPLAAAMAESLSGFWVLYGLVLMRAMRWAAPGLPAPKSRSEKKRSKRR
ncbi:hypothetical protein [Acidihalobacter aeolianus]|nr:hypothetical protein [Acidihalobacter aeolianus]